MSEDRMSEDRMSDRKRRGHSQDASAPEGPPRIKKVDPGAYQQVDAMLGSFAHRRFGPVLPTVAGGWFGAATEAEREDDELRTAFMLFFVHGWRDPQGLRIIDMFAEHGIELNPLQKTALAAMRQARFQLLRIEQVVPDNKQIQGREFFRDEPIAVIDRNSFESVQPGDGLLAWMMPVADLWRPIGVATRVPERCWVAAERALDELATALKVSREDLAERKTAQAFWTVYRAANALGPMEV